RASSFLHLKIKVMALLKILKSDLDKWVTNYENTRKDKKETRSCILYLTELKGLLTYMESHKEIDGVKIYFIRQNEYVQPKEPYRLQSIKGGVNAQLSIAIVSTCNYQDNSPNGESGADTYVEKDGKLLCL